MLGTSEFTTRCASALMEGGAQVCALVSMPRHLLPENPADIEGFAEENGIPYHEIEDINAPSSLELLTGYHADYMFSSWPRVLKKGALEIPRFFCIGTHPTQFPHNRGRHPLHWLISLGISETALSFFRMDEGIDTGNVLLQVPFYISPNDSIGDALAKMSAAAYKGTGRLHTLLLQEPSANGSEQDHGLANYWRERTPHDVTLDPRMTSDMVLRIVRSYAPPYPCANLVFRDQVLKISAASIAEEAGQLTPAQQRRMEPGRITSINGNSISLKVADTIVTLESQGPIPLHLRGARHIHPPGKYLVEFPSVSARLQSSFPSHESSWHNHCV